MNKKLNTLFLIFTLFTIHYSLYTADAQEQTVTMDISVVNPSDEETQEVEVKVDLPKELKKEDIVSSDGLKIGFDTEKRCLIAEGRVLLQPAEAAIYKLVVQDAWMIPEEEIKHEKLKITNEIKDPELIKTFIARLDKISAMQKESSNDIRARILAYRENQKEFDAIKDELRFASSGIKILRSQAQRIIRIILWLIILGAFVFLIAGKRQYLKSIINKLREKGTLNRRRFVQLPDKTETLQKSRPIEEDHVRDDRELSLGKIIVLKGLVTQEKMDDFLKKRKGSSNSIIRDLINYGLAEEKQVFIALSDIFNLPYIELKNAPIEEEAVKKIPAKYTWYYKIMPIKVEDGRIVCAISDPLNTAKVIEDVNVHLNYKLKLVLSQESQVVEAIKKFYGVGAETVDKILSEENGNIPGGLIAGLDKEEDIAKLAEDASVIKLVNQILIEAQEKNATDIHIEPYQGKLKLRYRIDGILYDAKVPSNIVYFLPAIVSRVKIMSGLNIVERRIPQDGRAKVKIKDETFDLRISTLPTPYGESMVIRILPVSMLFSLKELGLLESDLKILEELIKKPHGIIFVTGPTGSGKTTTLYACLNKIKKENPGAKILTVEDPIEYELEGITQMQVNPAINLTFATGLRSMLRHDPDIMMVGEVRDFETAEIAIRMALTGHLLFSTLHTNDAATGAMRLLDIGVEPYLVASSVEAFIAQRLVRVICDKCKEESAIPGSPPIDFKAAYKGRGCEACNFTGYKGRMAIYEILLVSEKIKELILRKTSSNEINKQAVLEGMKTLYRCGIDKVIKGITTFEEVLRVTQAGD